MDGNIERTVEICNRRGLHARAAARFVRLVEELRAEVMVSKDGVSVVGSSIMGLLMLSASIGTRISISVRGDNAQIALDTLAALVERRFDEE